MAGFPVLPVAALSLQSAIFRTHELEVVDVDDAVLAGLVRLRLALDRSHGWLLLGCIFVALASVIAVGVTVESRLAFGAYAAAVAAGTVGLGFVAERLSFGLFANRAGACGLSRDASERLFVAATDADHWLDVLTSCGHAPTDHELASFVRQR
ncbi:MAG: hypothetical protein Q8O67_11690 [Deltaproteobacteria bacterium]|nr:hypothetical protein [Deltaproteobacteria bacterium]